MKQDEFLRRYHFYRTGSQEEAVAEAIKANEEGIDGNAAVPIKFGELGWGLMLMTAYQTAVSMGIEGLETLSQQED